MTTPQEELRAAGDAQHVLDNPIFQKAKAEVYEKLRRSRQIIATHVSAEQVADLVRVEQVADQFFDYFELVLQTGKLAQQHLDDQANRKGLVDRGLALFRTMGRNSF